MQGANFSSWYRQDEGTFVVDAINRNANRYATYWAALTALNSSFDSIRAMEWNNGSDRLLSVSIGNVSQVGLSSSSVIGRKVIASTYKKDDFAASKNGGAALTDSIGDLPQGIDRLVIGATGPAFPLNGTISRLTYYPKRLTNAQLQFLSSQ
jgi:hypothetical protein